MNALDRITSSVLDVFSTLKNSTMEYLPDLIAALIIFLLGMLIAKLLQIAVRSALRRLGLDGAMQKLGAVSALERLGIESPPSRVVGLTLYWVALILFAQVALRVAALPFLARAAAAAVSFLPNVAVAAVIVVAGVAVSGSAGRFVTRSARSAGLLFSRPLGGIVSALIVVIAFTMALAQLRIATGLISMLVLITFACAGLASVLVFAMGSKEAMRNIVAGFYLRKQLNPGQAIEVIGEKGILEAVDVTQTRIRSKGKTTVMSNSAVFQGVIHHEDQ